MKNMKENIIQFLFLSEDEPVSMDQIEFLLSNLLHLKHVELQAKSLSDLADDLISNS